MAEAAFGAGKISQLPRAQKDRLVRTQYFEIRGFDGKKRSMHASNLDSLSRLLVERNHA